MRYFDSAATTPVRREVLEAMWPYFSGEFGNPSSHHTVGEAAAHAVEAARSRIAELCGARTSDVVFTSGGTEADNLAVKGITLASRRGTGTGTSTSTSTGTHVVISAIEHEAVVESAGYLNRVHGVDVDVAPVDRDGLVDLDRLAALLRPTTALVSVMTANNEIGTIQPIAAIAELCNAAGIPVHTDGVQAAGWVDVSLATTGAAALSLSGHKLGAPKGIGALVIRGRVPREPLIHGGGQERGTRSGTENVPGIVGLAVALDLAERERVDNAARVTQLRDEFIAEVIGRIPHSILTGHPVLRLPGVASFCFPGTSGEAVLLELERRGVVVSSGSACAAGSDEPSATLLAIGIDPAVAQTAVRFTFSTSTQRADVEGLADLVAAAVDSVAH